MRALTLGGSILLLIGGGCTTPAPSAQRVDLSFEPVVQRPAYPAGRGPTVLVDAAHGNFHTIDGRYGAFARLLERDGFVVESADEPVTIHLLESTDVMVISNAIKGGADAKWALPIPSAFTGAEIAALHKWVEAGGSLLLIADHMPFPGATADLAAAFGFVFYNGFAMKSVKERGILEFTRSDDSLADHAITRGRNDGERIDSVRSFTGQAFRAVEPVEALMLMPDDIEVWMPSEAWEFSDATPRVSAAGLVQGAVRRVGRGRIAVFGEAAMFTAQTQIRGDVIRRMGMNHPDAPHNQQFTLNVMHWLAGMLD